MIMIFRDQRVPRVRMHRMTAAEEHPSGQTPGIHNKALTLEDLLYRKPKPMDAFEKKVVSNQFT